MQHLCADSRHESTASGRLRSYGASHTIATEFGGAPLIVDHRAYELQPGQSRELLALSEREERQVQSKHLGNLVCFFTSRIGNVGRLIDGSGIPEP